MPIIKPTQDELVSGAWTRVQGACGLTNATESSFAMNIIRVMAAWIYDLYGELETAESAGNISTAVGDALDKIGAFFGVSRQQAQASNTFSGAPSVQFTNNGMISQSVPRGTRVWTPDDSDRAFFTTDDITVLAGSTAFVDVVAASPGAFYNTGAYTVTSHSLGSSTLSVTNTLPLRSGADVEADADYRSRIGAQIARREGPNLDAIRQACLDLPGVRDVSVQNLARGTGTFDVLILGWDRDVPQTVLDQVQTVLDTTAALGISGRAKGPITHYVDVDVYVTIKQGGNDAAARAAITQAVHGYLDNLPIEDGTGTGTVIYAELAARVQQAHPDILTTTVALTIDDLPALRADQSADPGERYVSRAVVVH